MPNTTLERLEADITTLTLTDQLRLMEHLAAYIRSHADARPISLNDSLAAMAQDPEIQRELQQINAEFALAEADGLISAT